MKSSCGNNPEKQILQITKNFAIGWMRAGEAGNYAITPCLAVIVGEPEIEKTFTVRGFSVGLYWLKYFYGIVFMWTKENFEIPQG